jgi:hypothetical protein
VRSVSLARMDRVRHRKGLRGDGCPDEGSKGVASSPSGKCTMASLLEGLLEARDFVLQARDAARDGKVINKEDGPDGEIGGHQAIEIFHGASDSFRPKKRRGVHGFFRLDNTS